MRKMRSCFIVLKQSRLVPGPMNPAACQRRDGVKIRSSRFSGFYGSLKGLQVYRDESRDQRPACNLLIFRR